MRVHALCVLFGLALGAVFGAAESRAQTKYPDRPVKMLVGFAAGGGTDVIARIVAQKMSWVRRCWSRTGRARAA